LQFSVTTLGNLLLTISAGAYLLLLLLAALAAQSSTLLLLAARWTVPAGISVRQREALLLNSLFRWRGIVTVLCAVSLSIAVKAEDRAACISTTLGTVEAGDVLDGRTFKLRDGREVLLAGIEVPAGRASAKASLARLLAGGAVVLKQTEPAGDRYGRLLVQAFMSRDGVERWIQAELLAAGDAQVGSRPGDAACAKALRAAEAPARRGRRGLWADSAYGTKASDDLAGLLARRGQFTVAEGKILSVRESGGTIYMNFGRVWSHNLTVTILRRNRPAFENAGMDPKKLEGARIRVRGWVEERGGPRIEAARPEQIEIAAQD
jgi:endonuclease YncB( thermonuclease family)